MSNPTQKSLHAYIALLILLPSLLNGRILIHKTTVTTTTTIFVLSPDNSFKDKSISTSYAVPSNQEQVLLRYLYFFPMAGNDRTQILDIDISDGDKLVKVEIQLFRNLVYLKKADTSSQLFEFDPENWNYIKITYKDGIFSLALTTSCKCSKHVPIYAVDVTEPNKKVTLKYVTTYGKVGQYSKISAENEHAAIDFLAKSYLPFVMMYNLYFDTPCDFLQIDLPQPQFLNSDLKKPSTKYQVIGDHKRNVILSNDYFLNYQEDLSLSVDFLRSRVKYRLIHLMNFTILNYFTHHFISIPTDSFIKSGHSTGNKVVGTIIVHRKSTFYNFITKELQEDRKPFMEKLIETMKSKGFDGYMLDFQKSSDDPDEILEWVTEFYHRIKVADNDYVLVWYDSLTKKGQVHHQGEVNESNIDFAQATDFFFADQSWTQENIKASKQIFRKDKIAHAIDIYGRGSVEGKFRTSRSAKILKDEGTSVALFAPGYTHERENGQSNKETYFSNEQRLWKEAELRTIYTFEKEIQKVQQVSEPRFTYKRDYDYIVSFKTDKKGISANTQPLNPVSLILKNSHMVDFQKSILPKLKTFDFFIDIKFENPNVLPSNDSYLVVVLFKTNKDVFGCATNYERKFMYNIGKNKPCRNLPNKTRPYFNKDTYNLYNFTKQVGNKLEEKLFIEKEKIYNFADRITTVEIHVFSINVSNPLSIQSINFVEIEFKKDNLLEQLVEKAVVNLPVTSFFNTGACDFVSFKGGRSYLPNYSYLYDYDINVDFKQDQIPITQQKAKKLADSVDMHIDNSMSYYGCSSLRVSAEIDNSNYLSNQLYKIDVQNNKVGVKVVYHMYKSIEKYFELKFLLIDESGNSINVNEQLTINANFEDITTLTKSSQWRELTFEFNNISGPLQLVVFAELKNIKIPGNKKLMFFVNIGQISIYDTSADITDDLDSILCLETKARRSFSLALNPKTIVVDLHIKAFQLESNVRIRNYVIYQVNMTDEPKGEAFVYNVYFKEFVVKNLVFAPGANGCENYNVMAVTEEGFFLDNEKEIVICEKDLAPIQMKP